MPEHTWMVRISRCLTGLYPWQDILFVSLSYQQDSTDSVRLKGLLFLWLDLTSLTE